MIRPVHALSTLEILILFIVVFIHKTRFITLSFALSSKALKIDPIGRSPSIGKQQKTMSLTKWKKKDCYGLTEYIECNYAKQSLQTHSVWFQHENAGSAFGYLDKPSSSSILPR